MPASLRGVTRLPPSSSCAAPLSEAGPRRRDTARPGAGGPARLVLWDVDHTLVSIGRVGREIYELAFAEQFGRPLPEVSSVSMAGRTDRAIALEVLAVAGVSDPLAQLDQFQRSRRPAPRRWPAGSASTAGYCPACRRRWPRWRPAGPASRWCSPC